MIIKKILSDSDSILKYKRIFTEIAVSVNQDPGDYIDNWFKNTDYFVVAIEGDGIVAFMGYKTLPNKFLYIVVTMVLKEYQNSGVATLMFKRMMSDFLLHNLGNILKTQYFIFRTQNPTAYAALHRKFELFPKVAEATQITADLQNSICTCVESIWPSVFFEKTTFVLHDAYLNYPSLAIEPEKVQWSGVESIDNMFRKVLHLDTESLDALLVVGRINLINLL